MKYFIINKNTSINDSIDLFHYLLDLPILTTILDVFYLDNDEKDPQNFNI